MPTSIESAPQIFEREYYQRLYDLEEQHWWAQGMRDAMDSLLAKHVRNKGQLSVLDIGCGTGLLMNYLKEKYSVDDEVVGLDISEHALAFCQQRGATKLLLGSATEVPLPSRSFDLIICIDTIQHLSGENADVEAIEEFVRLLKKGGLLYLRTNSRLGHLELSGADANQYRRYDVPTVRKLLNEAGLIVERASYLNMLPSAAAALKEFAGAAQKHEHTHHSKAIGPGLKIKPYKPGMGWLNSLMRMELQAEAGLLAAGIELPFGHSCGFVARRA